MREPLGTLLKAGGAVREAHKFGCVSETGDSMRYGLAASSEFERREPLARVRGGRLKRASGTPESCLGKNSGNSSDARTSPGHRIKGWG